LVAGLTGPELVGLVSRIAKKLLTKHRDRTSKLALVAQVLNMHTSFEYCRTTTWSSDIDTKIVPAVKETLAKYVTKTNAKSLFSNFETVNTTSQVQSNASGVAAEAELQQYIGLGRVKSDVCIFQEWSKFQHHFPHLYAMAMDHLSIPGSSSSVERLFSYAGKIVTATRSRLQAAAIVHRVSIGIWSKEHHKYNKDQSSAFK
jgi:hypothetical protein